MPLVKDSPIRRTGHWLRRRAADPHAWLVLLLVIPALLPLLAPGYFFKAHDARHSVFWLVEFDQAFRDGAVWPIWAPDHLLGFGYPLWLVYAPLAYFIGEAFHLLGLGFVVAVKATWALGFVFGALGMYRLARRWWGPAAGLIAALAYTYAPYHFVQIYVRAALAEFTALAIAPWMLLAFAALWDEPRPRRAAWAALSVGALLLAHSAASITYLPLLGAFLLVKAFMALQPRTRQRGPARVVQAPGRKIAWAGAAVVLGICLAGSFLIPLLLEKRFAGESIWLRNTYDYSLHFVYPGQFFAPGWGYGFSTPGANDGMSFQLGLLIVLAAAFGFGIALCRRGRDRLPHRAEALFLAGATLAALFLMTPAARPVWDVVPLVSMLQFPWRLLAVTAVTLALLAGAAVPGLNRAEQPGRPTALASRSGRSSPYAYVAALALVLASFPYTRPELSPVRPADESPLAVIEFELAYPDMRGITYWAERQPANEDSPLLAAYLAGQPLVKAAIIAGDGAILDQGHTANSARARVRATETVRLRFYTAYFPGWRATVDGQPAAITPDGPNGLIGLDVPPGEHEVRLRFAATPVRAAAAGLSLAGLAAMVLLALLDRRKGRGASRCREN